MSKTILLIQDDCRGAHSVQEALIRSGEGAFQVEWVRLCSEGLKRLAEEAKPGGQPVDVNSIGDAVISTDVGGRVTYLNAVAENLTGWSLEEAAGRPLEEVWKRRSSLRFSASGAVPRAKATTSGDP